MVYIAKDGRDEYSEFKILDKWFQSLIKLCTNYMIIQRAKNFSPRFLTNEVLLKMIITEKQNI